MALAVCVLIRMFSAICSSVGTMLPLPISQGFRTARTAKRTYSRQPRGSHSAQVVFRSRSPRHATATEQASRDLSRNVNVMRHPLLRAKFRIRRRPAIPALAGSPRVPENRLGTGNARCPCRNRGKLACSLEFLPRFVKMETILVQVDVFFSRRKVHHHCDAIRKQGIARC